MSYQLSVSRKPSPGQQNSTTPVSDTAGQIEAPEPPFPRSASGALLEALKDATDPQPRYDRESKLDAAIKLCIELNEGVCFEWLSRRHDMKAPDVFQPDAKVRLPLLNAEDLAWVCTWNQKRKLTVPIEFDLMIATEDPHDNALECIATMLAEPGLITSLMVRGGRQDIAFMKGLAEIIKTNQDLKTLDINVLGKFEGMQTLVDALESNTTLRKLILSHCKEGDFSRLCPVLAKNTLLEELALRSTLGSSLDTQALCVLLKTSKLTALDLSFTSFGASATKKRLASAKEKIKSLAGRTTKQIPRPVYLVVAAITANPRLRKLALRGWVIDNQLALALVPLLKDSRFCELKIGTISVEDGMGATTSLLLKEALAANPSLCIFDSDDSELRRHGNVCAEKNRERIRHQASAAIGRLAANANAPLPSEVTDQIACMLSRKEQATVHRINKPQRLTT